MVLESHPRYGPITAFLIMRPCQDFNSIPLTANLSIEWTSLMYIEVKTTLHIICADLKSSVFRRLFIFKRLTAFLSQQLVIQNKRNIKRGKQAKVVSTVYQFIKLSKLKENRVTSTSLRISNTTRMGFCNTDYCNHEFWRIIKTCPVYHVVRIIYRVPCQCN